MVELTIGNSAVSAAIKDDVPFGRVAADPSSLDPSAAETTWPFPPAAVAPDNWGGKPGCPGCPVITAAFCCIDSINLLFDSMKYL